MESLEAAVLGWQWIVGMHQAFGEGARFHWPKAEDEKVLLSQKELALLLGGSRGCRHCAGDGIG
jgi:hypothetical protein